MESTLADESINPAGKHDAEVYHNEKMIEDGMKAESPEISRAQAGRYTLQQDFRVLPMLGVIYAVSILDRINVSEPHSEGLWSWMLTRPDWLCRRAWYGRGP